MDCFPDIGNVSYDNSHWLTITQDLRRHLTIGSNIDVMASLRQETCQVNGSKSDWKTSLTVGLGHLIGLVSDHRFLAIGNASVIGSNFDWKFALELEKSREIGLSLDWRIVWQL